MHISEATVGSLVKRPLSDAQIRQFRADGFVRHPGSLDAGEVVALGARLADAAQVLAGEDQKRRAAQEGFHPSKYKHTAFIQVSGLWQRVPALSGYLNGLGLGALGCAAMGCDAVRLWGDHVLIKEAGGEPTPWHSDYHYVQTDTDKICSVWIPFRALRVSDGALGFLKGSHLSDEPSAHPISEAGAEAVRDIAARAGWAADFSDYAVGDCSLHYAKTLHGTRRNEGEVRRIILTVFLVDAAARVAEPRNDFQREYPIGAPGSLLDPERYPLLDMG